MAGIRRQPAGAVQWHAGEHGADAAFGQRRHLSVSCQFEAPCLLQLEAVNCQVTELQQNFHLVAFLKGSWAQNIFPLKSIIGAGRCACIMDRVSLAHNDKHRK